MKEAWRHVLGVMNPADLPILGCSVRQLLDSKWWEGPPWLNLPPENWPSGESEADEDAVMQERRKTVVSSFCAKGHLILRLLIRLRQGCTSPCLGPAICQWLS